MLALQRTVGNGAVTRFVQRVPGTNENVDDLAAQVRRMEVRDKATRQLEAFKSEVTRRVTAWEIAILNIGSAYSIAATNHSNAIAQKKKVDAIKSQAMFGVLAVATAGGLSWISALATAGETGLLLGALDTAARAGVGQAIGLGPALQQRVPTTDQTPVSTDPLVFQNERLVRLKKSQQEAQSTFRFYEDNFRVWNIKEWDNFDLDKQRVSHTEWLAQADLLRGQAELPPVEFMARELERGFWAHWAPALRVFEPEPTDPTGKDLRKVYKSPGTAVEARLDELGITKESGVGDFGWWTTDAEIDQLISWANGYQVRPFM
ncbi:hypothetical protein ALI144C_37845 [Actinosynnema sp. ALI-1.44]|nr:hypothetical protein ALI144C_37845 [Actinosynnema sp. ALI-1.44]